MTLGGTATRFDDMPPGNAYRQITVDTETGLPPSGPGDLRSANGPVEEAVLVVAGQALTWRTVHRVGSAMAIPVAPGRAIVLIGDLGPEAELWQRAYGRGFAHRMAGELTVASVTAGSLAQDLGEDGELLGSAIQTLGALVAELEEIGGARVLGTDPAELPDMIVHDAARTHAALLGPLSDQRIEVRTEGEFSVHSVASEPDSAVEAADLERARARVGLPWPSRMATSLGRDLGLARWHAVMQGRDDRMWCRVDDGTVLVTELWVRSRERGSRSRSA